MKNQKKAYTTPKLTVHGALAKITRNGGAPSQDVITGPNNDAFPNVLSS